MRTIAFDQIRDAIAELCQRANFELTSDMRAALERSVESETNPVAKNALRRILENAKVAKEQRLPMCQDTGLVVIFADVGQEVHIEGGLLRDAINEGIRKGWKEGYLRASVTGDPIHRKNTGDNTPAVIYTDLVQGDQLRLRLLAKGGGCENMSRFKMLTPADGHEGVVKFVVEVAAQAGPNACPPLVVGVGIGGSYDYSSVLSKKALLREVGKFHPEPHIAKLEREIAERINQSGLGPQGYGGDTTALAVQIETAACHIASLPVSVNIECHAHRHQEVVL
ncbi:MAG: fumarate hydratase [Chthoniobacterales bacterium]